MGSFASLADVEILDDLGVAIDPREYAFQANPAPLTPGTYRFRATEVDVAKNKQNQPIMVDDKFPILKLQKAAVVEPVENARETVGVFQDVRTKPYERRGAGGIKALVTDLNDWLFAFNAEEPIPSPDEARQLLQRHLESGDTFVARVEWVAQDRDYIDAEFAKVGGKDNATKEQKDAIYKTSRKYTKDFVVNGALQSSITGPSGNVLDARLQLTFLPSGKFNADGTFEPISYKLGPKKFGK